MGGAPERLCLAMGIPGRAFTQYTDFDFNSFARLGDAFLAASEDGLFLLGGPDDAGEDIAAEFALKDTDFGDPTPKRVLRARFGLEADGDLIFGLAPDKGAYTYRVITGAGEERGPWENFDPAKRGRYFQFKMLNLEGADFSLDSVVLTTAGKKPVNLFAWSTGLHTRVNTTRIPFDPETGMHALAMAINVDVDRTGRVCRRKGYTRLQAGHFHSLHCAGGHCLVVQEHSGTAAIYRVNEDGSLRGIRSGLTKGRPMAFHTLNGLICYSNGRENGVYIEGLEASTPWTMGEQPAGLRRDVEFHDPPLASCISSMGLHMLLADAGSPGTLWYSNDGSFNAFRLDDAHISFPDPITMIAPVSDGAWIGTERETVFLSGTNPDEWTVARRLREGVKARSRSATAIRIQSLGIEDAQGDGFFWISNRGVCWGGPGGHHINLSEPFIDPRDFDGAAGACLVAEDKAIFTIEG